MDGHSITVETNLAAATAPAHEEPFRLELGDIASRALHVVGVRGRERVSRPYSWEVTFTTTEPGLVDKALLGSPARLVIGPLAEDPRDVRGLVARLESCAGREDGRRAYRVRIVPRLARLGHRRASRVFEDRSMPEILSALLDLSGIAHRWELRDDYPRRAHCVQHDETDLSFLLRLCSEIGLWFRFESPAPSSGSSAPEVLVLSDGESAPDSEGPLTLTFRPGDRGALGAQERHVWKFETRREATPSAVTVRGYDFRRPRILSETHAALGGEPFGDLSGEVNEHHTADDPAIHAEHQRARALLAQLAENARTADAESCCPGLAAGLRFQLAGHDSADGAYLVAEIRHEGRAARVAGESHVYRNRLRCLPATVVPRPSRPRGRAHSVLETAVVVGPPGSEIHTDEHGRVRVRFHWQAEEARGGGPACWARVVEPWAGASWGAQWIPRVGMEVLVSFLAGDCSRPVVLGCLRNATHPAPFALPSAKTTSGIRTRSTPGGEGYNEVAFEDAKGAEELRLRAERDYTRSARHDALETTGHDVTVEVGHNRTSRVGAVDALTVGERLSVEVAGTARQEMSDNTIAQGTGGGAGFTLAGGDASLQAKGNISLSAGGDVTVAASGNITLKAGGTVIIEASAVIVAAGGAIQAEAGGAVVISGATVDLNP